jgi:hypothetical protein
MNGMIRLLAVGVAALVFGANGAAAQQSLRDIDDAGRSDLRATASISIPIGGRYRAGETAPRLELAMQTLVVRPGEARAVAGFEPYGNHRTVRARTALSFTLEQQPQMLLNGARIASFGPRLSADEAGGTDDKGTNGKTGGGGTALLVIGGVLAIGGLTAIVATQAVEEAARAPFRVNRD